jgi:hypothetical protein
VRPVPGFHPSAPRPIIRPVRALVVVAVLAAAAAAAARPLAPPALPPAAIVLPGEVQAVAASGPAIAVADDGCGIRVFVPTNRRKPLPVRGRLPCDIDGDYPDAVIDHLWLGQDVIAMTIFNAPSTHSEGHQLWTGPRPAGPLHRQGEWGWDESEAKHGYGCAWSAVAGGGVVAAAQVPNRTAIDALFARDAFCPPGEFTRVVLTGASRASLAVPGAWTPLATDGKRIALARIDANGHQTGRLALFAIGGKRLPTPRVDSGVIQDARHGWLTPTGLVLRTAGLVGPGWAVDSVDDASVAEGRVFYLRGRELRVRRVRGTIDRRLYRLPRDANPHLAAGSFGLAVGFGRHIYRIAWRTIDRTLTEH